MKDKPNKCIFTSDIQISDADEILEETVEALFDRLSGKRTTLLTVALANPFLPGSHTNIVFTHSGKRPAPVTDTISASQGRPLT